MGIQKRDTSDIIASVINAIDRGLLKGQIAADMQQLCLATLSAERAAPLDMLIFCPNCGKQHIDRPEKICVCGHHLNNHSTPADCNGIDGQDATKPCPCYEYKVAWNNPPHKSHTCRLDYGGCGKIFRVADVPTNGVAELKTRGKDDTWPEVG